MPIITPGDLASYLRLSAADEAATLLADLAESLVTETIGTPLPNPMPTRVKTITLEVAARAYRNPDGYSSETIDDYTYRRDAATRAAGVYLTPGEAAELAGISGADVAGAYSVPLWG